MRTDALIDIDYIANQSAGFMFARLLIAEVVFMTFYSFLAFIGDEASSIPTIPGFHISTLDIKIILVCIPSNFILFLLIFAAWQSVEYRISIHSLIIRRGFTASRDKYINLADIEGCKINRNILGNYFNYATIKVTLQHGEKPVSLKGITHPKQFKTQLETRMLANRKLHIAKTSK
ncbi:MAG: PH domain-containing protein [Candidatus Nomurabacteria bacterium]|nr:MAG: PH domain-containing protein [Candidatus Nomurabacteria bacterium]